MTEFLLGLKKSLLSSKRISFSKKVKHCIARLGIKVCGKLISFVHQFCQLFVFFWTLLGIDVSRIIELRDLLDMMDISRLNKENIGAEIQIEKQRIIKSFLNAT
jgi:hypothetical protein